MGILKLCCRHEKRLAYPQWQHCRHADWQERADLREFGWYKGRHLVKSCRHPRSAATFWILGASDPVSMWALQWSVTSNSELPFLKVTPCAKHHQIMPFRTLTLPFQMLGGCSFNLKGGTESWFEVFCLYILNIFLLHHERVWSGHCHCCWFAWQCWRTTAVMLRVLFLSGLRMSPDPSFVTTVPGKPFKLQVLNQKAAFKFLPLWYQARS